MTKRLEEAFAAAAKWPEEEQDRLAEWVLAELASDKRWAKAFFDSQNALSKLASEALGEHQKGRTKKLDPDRL